MKEQIKVNFKGQFHGGLTLNSKTILFVNNNLIEQRTLFTLIRDSKLHFLAKLHVYLILFLQENVFSNGRFQPSACPIFLPFTGLLNEGVVSTKFFFRILPSFLAIQHIRPVFSNAQHFLLLKYLYVFPTLKIPFLFCVKDTKRRVKQTTKELENSHNSTKYTNVNNYFRKCTKCCPRLLSYHKW